MGKSKRSYSDVAEEFLDAVQRECDAMMPKKVFTNWTRKDKWIKVNDQSSAIEYATGDLVSHDFDGARIPLAVMEKAGLAIGKMVTTNGLRGIAQYEKARVVTEIKTEQQVVALRKLEKDERLSGSSSDEADDPDADDSNEISFRDFLDGWTVFKPIEKKARASLLGRSLCIAAPHACSMRCRAARGSACLPQARCELLWISMSQAGYCDLLWSCMPQARYSELLRSCMHATSSHATRARHMDP